MVARVGGDEFVILCTDSGPGQAERVAHRLVCEIGRPVVYQDQLLVVGVSIGIASAACCADPDELLSQADNAMLQAKWNGSGPRLFESEDTVPGPVDVSRPRDVAAGRRLPP